MLTTGRPPVRVRRQVVLLLLTAAVTVVVAVPAAPTSAAASAGSTCSDTAFRNFGVVSAYHTAAGDEGQLAAAAVTVEDCEPAYAFHLQRHGTRWGSHGDHERILSLKDLRNKILANERAGREIGLCEEDLRAIREWTTGVDKVPAYGLTDQGQTDLLRLGSRFAHRFPFLRQLSRDEIVIKHGITQRTKDSAAYFAKGLLNQNTSTDGYDYLCDFFDTCPTFDASFLKYLVDGPYVSYQKGDEMKDVIRRVSTKLGFSDNLSFDDIHAIYTACAFETAWNISKVSRNKPAWCAVFGPEDFQVLEYWSDLQENQRTGYYNQHLHSMIGCKPIQEMYSYFLKAVEGKLAPTDKARFYFTHDTLLNQVVTFLRLFYDPLPLTSTKKRDRHWHVSHFSPFASNLGAVLFRCGVEREASRYKVQFYLNESPIEFDLCDGSVCTWKQISNIFGDELSKCDTVSACTGIDKVVKTATSVVKKISSIFG